MVRAVCYPRVSSARQRDAHTIDSQLRMLPEFIARQGWDLVAPPMTYVDDGRTAKAGHLEARTGLQALLRDAAAGKFDVVVVVDQDRLTRSEDLVERGAILGALQRAGVKLASAISGQVLDLDSSHGDLMASLGGYFSAEWSRKHRARIMEGKATTIARGGKPAGPTPYGLTYTRETGAWGIHPERGPVIRDVYARAIRGESLSEIARHLEATRAPVSREGTWTASRVRHLIRLTTYRGIWLAQKARRVEVAVPALVSDATWHAAQAALTRRRPANWTRGHHVNLCQGVSVCGLCGAPMGATGGGPVAKNYRYYVCRNKRMCGRAGARCPNLMRRILETDALVWARLRTLVLDDELLAAAVAPTSSGGEAATWERDAKDYERRLRKLERAESEILALYRRGKVSAGAFERELAAATRDRQLLERNRDVAREQLGRAALGQAQHEAVAVALEELRTRVDSSDPAQRRALVLRLVPPGVGAITMRREAIEIAGLLPLPTPSGAVFPVFAAGYSSGSGDNGVIGVRFRIVA